MGDSFESRGGAGHPRRGAPLPSASASGAAGVRRAGRRRRGGERRVGAEGQMGRVGGGGRRRGEGDGEAPALAAGICKYRPGRDRDRRSPICTLLDPTTRGPHPRHPANPPHPGVSLRLPMTSPLAPSCSDGLATLGTNGSPPKSSPGSVHGCERLKRDNQLSAVRVFFQEITQVGLRLPPVELNNY